MYIRTFVAPSIDALNESLESNIKALRSNDKFEGIINELERNQAYNELSASVDIKRHNPSFKGRLTG